MQVLGDGSTPQSDQQVRSHPFLSSFGCVKADTHLAARRLINLFYIRIEPEFNSFSLQTFCQSLGDLYVFMAQDLCTSLKDGDLAAEPMHQLSKLETNVPRAEYKQT